MPGLNIYVNGAWQTVSSGSGGSGGSGFAMNLIGVTDASTNPNYPPALLGDAYFVSVAGKVGGAAGKPVVNGDIYIASLANAGGDEATVGTSWLVLHYTVAGYLFATNNLSDLPNVVAARTNLGLGTAALLDEGVGAGQVIKLDGAGKLPAVDGSQLTNVLPSSYPASIISVLDAGGFLTATALEDALAELATRPGQIEIGADGGGAVLVVGNLLYIEIPFNLTLTGWMVVADAVGSVRFDLWVDTYANYPPTIADSIVAADYPKLTGVQKAMGICAGWTLNLNAGDIMLVNIDSAATITKALLTISYTRR